MSFGFRLLLVVLFAITDDRIAMSAPVAAVSGLPWKGVPVQPATNLQEVLDRGENLYLESGRIYNITNPLVFKKPGQVISTRGAKYISEYAVLRLTSPLCAQLVDGNSVSNVVLEQVVLDGNRYTLSDSNSGQGGDGRPLVFFGGKAASGQIVRNCVFMNARTWSTLKVHEGATDTLVESNIFLSAGTDARGNGREVRERPPTWGDSISCAARRSIVRNNLIIDSTDAGIVLFGAPGSTAEDNVIAAISRESLGAINLVDPLGFYAIDGDLKRTDYRGTVVRNNLIDVYGARIHIAVPMGGAPWAPKNDGLLLVGAVVEGNTISGGAGGYGFIVNGVDGFVVTNNKSTARYSGLGDGLGPQKPPDEPGPFIYNPATIGNSVLQPDFVAANRHLSHLLRCNHGPTNVIGYRVYVYGAAEADAVVSAAYVEMLGRAPKTKELKQMVKWLTETKGTADQVRRYLMMTPEFISRFGSVTAEDLHPYRIRLWLDILDGIQRDHLKKDGNLPSARQLYGEAMKRLSRR